MTDLEKITQEREKIHGKWQDNGIIMDDFLNIFQEFPNWKKLLKSQRSALIMVAAKLSRILSGDPNHQDHVDDAMNYLRLGFKKE